LSQCGGGEAGKQGEGRRSVVKHGGIPYPVPVTFRKEATNSLRRQNESTKPEQDN